MLGRNSLLRPALKNYHGPCVKKPVLQLPCLNARGTPAIVLQTLPRWIAVVDKVEWSMVKDGNSDKTVKVAGANSVDRRTHQGRARGFMAGLDAKLRVGAGLITNTDAGIFCIAP